MICVQCCKSFDGIGVYCPECAAHHAPRKPRPSAVLELRESSKGSGTLPAGNLWLRAEAFFLDYTISSFVVNVLGLFLVGRAIPVTLLNDGGSSATGSDVSAIVFTRLFLSFFSYFVALILFSLLYKPLFEWSRFHASPGKYVAGLAVLGEDEQPLGLAKAIARNFAKLLPLCVTAVISFLFYLLLGPGADSMLALLLAVILLVLLGPYMLVFGTAKKQALHDVISGCVVYQQRDVATSTWLVALFLGVSLLIATSAIKYAFNQSIESVSREPHVGSMHR